MRHTLAITEATAVILKALDLKERVDANYNNLVIVFDVSKSAFQRIRCFGDRTGSFIDRNHESRV